MTNQIFAGSGTLVRFIFRRDRFRLCIWVAAFAGFVIALVPVFENLIMSGAESQVMVEMMKNPAMIAIVGPVYGVENYHTGAAYANMMLVFSVMIAGVMNIFLVARHNRQDEELGRLEVIRSFPVGRLSNLASSLIAAVLVNLLLGLLTGWGLFLVRGEGMQLSGCMLFGAAVAVIGLFFSASTAVFCQVTANNRLVLALSFFLMLFLYMLRAVGDVGIEGLSLISPLGLILRTENFVKDVWWPVWIILILTLGLTALAFGLARMRDLGRGLVSERPGKRHAPPLLSNVYGLAIRLLKSSLVTWALIIFIVAGMYGSVFGDLESFISSNEMLAAIFAANTEFTMTEQFIAMLMSIMTMISIIPILSYVHRVASEEKNGYAEHLLGRSVSRSSQMSAYFVPAFVMSIVQQLLTALGFWSVGSVVLATAPEFRTFLKAACSYLPAVWIFIGIAMALVAFLPGKQFVSFLYLGYTFISVYIGTLARFPEWVKKRNTIWIYSTVSNRRDNVFANVYHDSARSVSDRPWILAVQKAGHEDTIRKWEEVEEKMKREKRKKIITYSCLGISLLFIGLGMIRKEHITVMQKAVNICLECIGIG